MNTLKIPKESKLKLTTQCLNNLLERGKQVSATDFTGWIWIGDLYDFDFKHYRLGLEVTGDIYIQKHDLKDITIKDIKKLIKKCEYYNILEFKINEPFEEFSTLEELNIDPDIVEFIETPFIGKSVQNIMEIEEAPKLTKTKKIYRTAMISCPECGRMISFDVDDALNNLRNENDNIHIKCKWCKSKTILYKEYVEENGKIVYKEKK